MLFFKKIYIQFNPERILVSLIVLLSCAILVIPAFPITDTLYPFIFTKAVIFQICSEIIVVCWLILCVCTPRYRLDIRNPIIITLFCFLIALLLSTLFSINPAKSFFSGQERMTGFITWAHYILWFFVLSATIKDRRIWRGFLFVTLAVSVYVSVYMVLENYEIVVRLGSLVSTIGNRIFTGGYLLIHVFLSLFLLFTERRRVWQCVAFCFFSINVFGIILAGSRGPTLGFLGGLIFLWVSSVFLLKGRKETLRKIPMFLCVVFCIGGLLGLLYSPFGRTLTDSIASFKGSAVHKILYHPFDAPDRLRLWEMAFQGWQERPLFGWGLENYIVISNKYKRYGDWEGTATPLHGIQDKPHNQVIEFLATAGLPGIITYIGIWIIFFIILFRTLRRREDEKEQFGLLCCAALLGAYFLYLLTVFETPSTLIGFFFSIAFINYYSTRKSDSIVNKPAEFHCNIRKGVCILIIVFCASGVVYYGNVMPLLKNMQGIQALRAMRMSYITGTMLFQEVLSGNSFTNREFRLRFANQTFNLFTNNAIPLKKVRNDIMMFVIDELEKNTHASRYDVDSRVGLIRWYGLAAQDDPRYREKYEPLKKEIMVLTPERYSQFIELIDFFSFTGDTKTAENFAEAYVHLIPKEEKAEAYLRISDIYSRKHHTELSQKALQAAETLGYDRFSESFVNMFFKSLSPSTSSPWALSYVDKLTQYAPQNSRYQGIRIIVYYRAGKKQESRNMLQRLERIDKKSAENVRKSLKL